MAELSLDLATSVSGVLVTIALASVVVNIGLTAFHMMQKSVNEASV